jgi:hypothetical protein
VDVKLWAFAVRLECDQAEVEPRRVRAPGEELDVPDLVASARRDDDGAHRGNVKRA